MNDLDDCGADLLRWWNEIGRAEQLWECPYCGQTFPEPRICCKENHCERVEHEQA